MRAIMFLCGLCLIVVVAAKSQPEHVASASTFAASETQVQEYPDNYYRVAFSHDSSNAFKARMREGFRAWEAAAPGLHFIEIGTPCIDEHCIVVSPSTTEYLRTHHQSLGPDSKTIGWTDNDFNPITVEIATDLPVVMRYTILHELGHSLGLAHGAPHSVMYWHADLGSDKITCADVRAYYYLNRLSPPACKD